MRFWTKDRFEKQSEDNTDSIKISRMTQVFDLDNWVEHIALKEIGKTKVSVWKRKKKDKSEITENVYMSNKQMKREDGISKGRSNRDKWLRGTDSRLRLLWL